MTKLIAVTFVVMFVLIAGGAAFLAAWDIPVHSTPVEKIIPDARLPK